jgi:thymidylate kinase
VLVLDGSPGAGKTTLLGHLLETLPETLIVFPEAQPPPALASDAQVMRALLAEDRARIQSAAHLHALDSALVVASDRCHISVLAYRYALATTGRASRRVFDHALATVAEFRLDQGHRGDTVLILRLDPAQSLRRRAAHARDGRYRLWYDREFLTAYNHFLDHLHYWMPLGAGWAVCDAADPASWSPLLPIPDPATRHHAQGPVSPPACGCTEPRSALVTSHGVPTQLYTSALHRRHADGSLRCLRGAQEITVDWLATHPQPIGRRR